MFRVHFLVLIFVTNVDLSVLWFALRIFYFLEEWESMECFGNVFGEFLLPSILLMNATLSSGKKVDHRVYLVQ